MSKLCCILIKISIGVISIICGIGLFANILRIFGLIHPEVPQANICDMQMKTLGVLLNDYAQEKGHLPHSDKWINELAEWRAKKQKPLSLKKDFKCPADSSSSKSSFTMSIRLSARSTDDISVNTAARTVLLKEKRFPDNHGHILYLDGHVTRSQ